METTDSLKGFGPAVT